MPNCHPELVSGSYTQGVKHKLRDSKMLNTDDNNGATELSLQHDMAYRL